MSGVESVCVVRRSFVLCQIEQKSQGRRVGKGGGKCTRKGRSEE